MKNTLQFIISLWATLIFSGAAAAASLDDLYRDIIRSDNDGYLPLFVKNRVEPDILVEEEVLKKAVEPPENKRPNNLPKAVNLTHTYQAETAQQENIPLKWQQTLQAVEQNRVTPLDLEEINRRVSLNDGKAIEVLAWMYTKGIGVAPDLPAAFKLYERAVKLQVPNAKENAAKVYKAMTPEQRAEVK